MKTDIEKRWPTGFARLIGDMCVKSLRYEKQMKVEGVLAITLDSGDVLIVNVNKHHDGSNSRCFVPKVTLNSDETHSEAVEPILQKLFGDFEGSFGHPAHVSVSGIGRTKLVGELIITDPASDGKMPQAKLILNEVHLPLAKTPPNKSPSKTTSVKIPKQKMPSPEKIHSKMASPAKVAQSSKIVTAFNISRKQPPKFSSPIKKSVKTGLAFSPSKSKGILKSSSASQLKIREGNTKKSLDSVIAKLHHQTSGGSTKKDDIVEASDQSASSKDGAVQAGIQQNGTPTIVRGSPNQSGSSVTTATNLSPKGSSPLKQSTSRAGRNIVKKIKSAETLLKSTPRNEDESQNEVAPPAKRQRFESTRYTWLKEFSNQNQKTKPLVTHSSPTSEARSSTPTQKQIKGEIMSMKDIKPSPKTLQKLTNPISATETSDADLSSKENLEQDKVGTESGMLTPKTELSSGGSRSGTPTRESARIEAKSSSRSQTSTPDPITEGSHLPGLSLKRSRRHSLTPSTSSSTPSSAFSRDTKISQSSNSKRNRRELSTPVPTRRSMPLRKSTVTPTVTPLSETKQNKTSQKEGKAENSKKVVKSTPGRRSERSKNSDTGTAVVAAEKAVVAARKGQDKRVTKMKGTSKKGTVVQTHARKIVNNIRKKKRNTWVRSNKPAVIKGEAKKSKRRCEKCINCRRVEDCAVCLFCKDKLKFGGQNSLRQKCVKKQCKEYGIQIKRTV